MPKRKTYASRFEGKVGYTNDGFVWLQMDAQDEKGNPIKINVTYNLQDAMSLSKFLKDAAMQAANKRSPLILPQSAMGG